MAVDVDRHPIAWREAGPSTGHVVALLHGISGSRTSWEPQLDALAEAGYHAAAWDMPGYGASEPVDVLSFPQLADAVAGWLEEMGASAHLVGLSMGGMVALHVAVRHPSLARSLTIVGANAAFDCDRSASAGDWVHDRLQPLREGRAPADIADESIARLLSHADREDARSVAAHAMSRVNAVAMEAAVHCVPTHDVRDELDSVTAPTLVVAGDDDKEMPVSCAHDLAGRIAGARLAIVPDSGHLVNLEQPEIFNQLLLEHLATAP